MKPSWTPETGPETGRYQRSRSLLAVAAALLLVAAGCGRGEKATTPGEEGMAEKPAMEQTAPAPEPAEQGAIQEENLPADRGAEAQKSLSATIESRSGSGISGTAVFEQTPDGVRVVVDLSGATPGEHGVHIHEIGDCSAEDASSAGGHFNPGNTEHGAPDATPHHAGDLGNITVKEDGTGTLELITKDLSLRDGPNAIAGRAIVVHAGRDDLTSQPSGNSGARIGCGVIK